MKTAFTRFLKYAFKDRFSQGILLVSLIFIIVSIVDLIRNHDWENLKWSGIILTPVWALFWIKQAQAYKQYRSFPNHYKHNLYD